MRPHHAAYQTSAAALTVTTPDGTRGSTKAIWRLLASRFAACNGDCDHNSLA
jgi:hypothetical protein